MGEEVRGVSEAPAVGPLASEARSEGGIGRYLAAQRRLRGVSLDELAELTKIPCRSLERLESGAFDSASDGFVRGFVRTVAEALGLDPDEAVMRLLQEPRGDLESTGRATGPLEPRMLLAQLAALVAVVGVAVLVWQLVIFWRSPSAEPRAREVILRRDPVRELALEVRAGATGHAAAEQPEAPAAASPAPTPTPTATATATATVPVAEATRPGLPAPAAGDPAPRRPDANPGAPDPGALRPGPR